MRNNLRYVIYSFSLLIGVCFTCAAFGAVPVNKPRIITLTPSLAELVVEAGGEKYLVGVSQWSNIPSYLDHLPRIASHTKIETDKIKSLKPNIIFVESGAKINTQLKQLPKSIHIVPIKVGGIYSIAENIRYTGKIINKKQYANQSAAKVQEQLKQLKKEYQTQPNVSYFFEFYGNPAWTFNNKSYLASGLKICGGVNVFGHAHPDKIYFQVSKAEISKTQPSIIFLSGNVPKSALAKLRTQNSSAFNNGKVISLPKNTSILRYSAAMINSLQEMCRKLHDGSGAGRI